MASNDLVSVTVVTYNSGRFIKRCLESVLEQKYLNMFHQLSSNPPTHEMEPIPGHFERRRRDRPAALDVLRRLPSGPVRPTAAAGHPS